MRQSNKVGHGEAVWGNIKLNLKGWLGIKLYNYMVK